MVISKESRANKLFKAAGLGIYHGFLRHSERLAPAKIEAFQLRHVKKALLQAQKVPYYREQFARIGFRPERDLRQLSDLRALPILTKADIQANHEALVNPAYRGPAVEYTTSGSTGEQLAMLLTPAMVAIDKAMILRHLGWATRKPRPTIFALRSYVREDKTKPFFRYSAFENSYYLPAYELCNSTAPAYVAELRRINPDIIRGYPSSIAFLCDYLRPEDVARLTRLRGVFTSSETLTTFERAKIEAVFGRRLFNWYGMTEPAVIIMECEHHDKLHVCWEYGHAELLETDVPGVKRLVTTSYYNHVMPFIRYETGDLVEEAGEPCRCGRTLPSLAQVLGRKDDYVVGRDNRRLPSLNFYTLFREFTKISAFQIVQYATMEVLVQIRVRAPLDVAERDALLAGLRNRIGDDIPLHLRETEHLFTNSDGKTLVVLKKPGSLEL